MDRFRRVANLWSWLPAFRGVAEHESIQKAAAALAVSASALSRTVKLLEDAVEVELFVRQPTGLRLTDAGRDLLAVTRDAMRSVDDFVERRRGAESGGRSTFTIACVADVIAVAVAHALPLGMATLRVDIRCTPAEAMADELLQGTVDVGLMTQPCSTSDAVECSPVGRIALGVYRGRSAAEAQGSPLVVPAGIEPPDGSVATATSLDAARALARVSGARIVLPDGAFYASERASLDRVDDFEPALGVYAAHRRPIGPSRTADLVGELLGSMRRTLS